MTLRKIILSIMFLGLFSCNSNKDRNPPADSYPNIKIVSAMRNVMWKGELGGKIRFDTISNKKGLYGIGPLSYLAGEVLINNGVSYVSKVTTDSTMTVETNFNVSAPFFVYTNVTEWDKIELPSDIKTIRDIEKLVDEKTVGLKRPFAFKLRGKVSRAIIHIQNLPVGTKVSSPAEAHQGQTNYEINNEDVEIIGFFSTEHKGVFTHHDSNIHLHLITNDKRKMGHLDEVEIEKMKIYFPIK
ncbi:acetolactate decarboxylase [Winogradskyella sp. PE311]|uniref:acetolactate decarboxylase n=1 Tax=Winogradskyella sp. PE311 TaxID=3366943 RepID=UPI0039807A3A